MIILWTFTLWEEQWLTCAQRGITNFGNSLIHGPNLLGHMDVRLALHKLGLHYQTFSCKYQLLNFR
jgi:hypothetical protein